MDLYLICYCVKRAERLVWKRVDGDPSSLSKGTEELDPESRLKAWCQMSGVGFQKMDYIGT